MKNIFKELIYNCACFIVCGASLHSPYLLHNKYELASVLMY